MKRTSLLIEEETLARLAAIARRQGVPTSKVIREALGTYVVQRQAESGEAGPLDALIGLIDGPAEPLGARTEEIVAEEVARRFGAERVAAEARDERDR